MMPRGWLDAAIMLHDTDGHVIPTLFAESSDYASAAAPTTNDANLIGDASRSALLAVMAAAVGAERIGIVAEVWDREYTPETAPQEYHRGDLERAAETDPDVHTAIIVLWLDLVTRVAHIDRAVQRLDDDGRAWWDRSSHSDIDGAMVSLLKATVPAVEMTREQAGVFAPQVADALGWSLGIWAK